jgi:hypothetical protein
LLKYYSAAISAVLLLSACEQSSDQKKTQSYEAKPTMAVKQASAVSETTESE